MNLDNLTPAQMKAIENGGTNNAVVGNSLVKRGVMVKQEDMSRAIIELRFVLSAEYAAHDEKRYADAIEQEEQEADKTAPAFEAWQIAGWNAEDRDREIESLRNEFEDADDERREQITAALAVLGTVVYPEGSPQYTEYTERLRSALAEWKQDGSADAVPAVGIVHIDDVPGQGSSDAEIRLAEAIDADDTQAIAQILPTVDVIVRDPAEKRYAYVGSWTDENLLIKQEIITRRLNRRTLLIADRKQAERHLRMVTDEIAKRGL